MNTTGTPLITLTTDFGRSDGYVGTMEGVIYSICPTAAISHLSHLVPPQNIQAGGFILYQSFRYFPPHTIHCAVIDPGVGSHRRAAAIETEHGIFVGPDNGLFDLVLSATTIRRAVTLTNPAYQLPSPGATFHGRDIFSPAAAHLAAGVLLSELGPAIADLESLVQPQPHPPGTCQVIHVDHFGNVVLSLTAADVHRPDRFMVRIGDTIIRPLRRTFADVDVGDFVLYVGSSFDHIEIAIRNGNAAQSLELQQGDVVQYSAN
jgi:S-adenosylmethionine hydrolase